MKKKKEKTAKEIKVETVDALYEKVSRAKSITFADYRGLTAENIAELRGKIKTAGGELIVTKNSLILRALAKDKLEAELSQFEGPTATIFAYDDEIAPIKEISESQKIAELPKFKFGFFEKKQVTATELESLAKLPGKDALRAKVVGALVSPIYGVVSVLSANIRNLVNVLDQIEKSKA